MRKSTKLKIFRRKKRSVILSVLKRHSLRQHTEVEDSEREDCSFGKIKERVEHRRMGSILCREKLPIGADGEYHPENPVKMAGEYISLGEFQEISETELKQWLGRK